MNSLTENLRTACRELVQKELPEEAPVFDHIWDAFWKALGCKNIEDLQANVNIGNEPVSIRTLGAVATGGSELDTLFVLGSLTSAITTLRTRDEVEPIDIERIADVLKKEFLRINAPDHLRPVLFEHGTGLLAGLLGVKLKHKEESTSITSRAQLWVEHCEERTGPREIPVIVRDHYDPVTVETEFRKQRKTYDLFVDEQVPCIYLPRKKDAAPLWSEIDPRHRRLLGLILEAFSGTREITCTAICRQALRRLQNPHETYSVHYDGRAVRRTVSELKRHLHGILKKTVKAERTENRYVVTGQIAYCWIRSNNRSSRLI